MAAKYRYSKKSGTWIKTKTECAYDYETADTESSAILIAFFQAFPDYFLDLALSDSADFELALPQRLVFRAGAEFADTMTTTSRGFGKTYEMFLSAMVEGVLYPGQITRHYGPSQKMNAELCRVAFHQIERNYPMLSMLWKIKSESKDDFWIITDYGSEIRVGAIQGGNCHEVIAEEMGQETDPKFDFNEFESKVSATCRQAKVDSSQIVPHFKIITNASIRQNPTYYKYRQNAYNDMATKPFGKAFVVDISWEMTVLFGIRTKEYVDKQKSNMTREEFLRQMCAYYTGTADNPMVSDEDLSLSRRLRTMESRHCGDPNAIYIIGHDVSYEQGTKNAKCADAVLKLTLFPPELRETKRDKYKKELVYVDNYAPPKDYRTHAEKVKKLWEHYCLDGGNPTYIALDSWQYGQGVMQELVKPAKDGVNLCCYKHLECREIESKGALQIIYPIKAGGTGVRDPDYEIIKYARVEFEQGNISLLTADIMDGLEAYKRKHHIKTDESDIRILSPYQKTNELCEQIANLCVVASGKTNKEERISLGIQRDSWSALKYALWFASILEKEAVLRKYQESSTWEEELQEEQSRIYQQVVPGPANSNLVNRLLRLRKV